MILIRKVESEIAKRYPEGRMRCPTHLSIGQEASASGIGIALQHTDLSVSSHRAHAHYIAKGGNINAMIAEIYGKVTGCSRGRGGSMHLIDRSVGFKGSTAIVANSIPVGVGLALALQLKGSQSISAVFFGDGSVEEGAFYESVNFAVVRKLPVLFVCENNLYSVYSSLKVRQPESRKIHLLAEAIGVPSKLVDGNDVEAVYTAANQAIQEIKKSGGPRFLELSTYRWLEHCGPNYDNNIGYRSEEEFLDWKKRDPIPLFEAKIQLENWITKEELEKLYNEIETQVLNAFEFAESSPYPSSLEAFQGLYAAEEMK